MTTSVAYNTIVKATKHNCDISDARDHGIYSMCTMVLKLRNLFKWEHNLQPWEEPEASELLNWIDAKEKYWATIAEESFSPISFEGKSFSPYGSEHINNLLQDQSVIYGAGYGSSMKSIFFLAEKLEKRSVAGCPVLILGEEKAKEMASPFAMVQDGHIYIRRESLRFFLWDQIQELRSSRRSSFQHALDIHGLLENGQLDQKRFKQRLDGIVDEEIDLFIYHEVGEVLEKTLDSETLKTIVSRFPGTVMELVCRSIKDILADTHPAGLLSNIITEQREATLSFYIGFLDGVRKKLFPQIFTAWQRFFENRDWRYIEHARIECRKNNEKLAEKIQQIASQSERQPDKLILDRFSEKILIPLGLDTPE